MYMNIVYKLLPDGIDERVKDKVLFDKLLIALYAGFGVTTPSIILPRFSASTQADMSFNLIAGFTSAGLAHLGACREMMLLLKQLGVLPNRQVNDELDRMLNQGYKIPGFGHPLFYTDPRTAVLHKLTATLLPGEPYLALYEKICKRMKTRYELTPNIDAIAATILSSLGVIADYGAVVFLFARLPAMIAHSIEKKTRPAFGFKRAEARERFVRFPFDWV